MKGAKITPVGDGSVHGWHARASGILLTGWGSRPELALADLKKQIRSFAALHGERGEDARAFLKKHKMGWPKSKTYSKPKRGYASR